MSRPQDKLWEVKGKNSVRLGSVKERISQWEEQCKKTKENEGPKSKTKEQRKSSNSSTESGYPAEDNNEFEWKPTDLTNEAIFSPDPFKALDNSTNGPSGQNTDTKRSADRFKINAAEKIYKNLLDVLNLKEYMAYAGQLFAVIGNGNPETRYSLYPEIQTGKLVCYTGAVHEGSLYEADVNIANYVYRFEHGKDQCENGQSCSIFTTMLQGCRALALKPPLPPSATNKEGSDGDLHFENDSSLSVCFNTVNFGSQPAEVSFTYLENSCVQLDMTYNKNPYCLGVKMDADCSKGEVTAYPKGSKPQTVQEAKFVFGEFVHLL